VQPAIPFGVVGRLPITDPSICVETAVDGGVKPLPPQHPKVADGAKVDKVPVVLACCSRLLFKKPGGGARLIPAL